MFPSIDEKVMYIILTMRNTKVNNISAIEQLCDASKAEVLIVYLTHILEINRQINLTSITNFKEACLLHLEDSLVALPEINEAIDGKYCDIGCGGGFPGVPIGVASGRETWLVDSRAKKIKAVQECIKTSKVDEQTNFHCVADRIEDFSASHKSEFSVVTARALSSLVSLLELASPLLKIGGSFIALKSQIDDVEETEGLNVAPMCGFELDNKRNHVLSDGETKRVIYTFKKVRKAKIKLPRRNGLAQKKPLLA